MFVLLIIGCLACTIPAVSALYTFEGIPLTVTAQGEVEGDILTFGTYGLSEPPVDVTFTLPRTPRGPGCTPPSGAERSSTPGGQRSR